MPSAAPRSERTTSTEDAGVGDDADAVTTAEPTIALAPPSARAPRSRLRRDMAENSGQQSPRVGESGSVTGSPPEVLGGVEERREETGEQPPHHWVVRVDRRRRLDVDRL